MDGNTDGQMIDAVLKRDIYVDDDATANMRIWAAAGAPCALLELARRQRPTMMRYAERWPICG
jgi:prolyl-tRNA editing enzyme YbaK/EbsC (Cys-tRNA(Pro) deacylase)